MSESLTITLPDGSQKQVPAGTRPLDVAQSISPRLADDAVVASVNGQLYDLNAPARSRRQARDPDFAQTRKRSKSTAIPPRTCCAAAVLELFPGNQARHRPAHRHRLLLRFRPRRRPSPPRISKKSKRACGSCRRKALPYERKLTAKTEGLSKYADDWMKVQLIEENADEVFSEYTLGPHFIDFCRGPHVPATSRIKAFKLLSIAGAYWKGDEHNNSSSASTAPPFSPRKISTNTSTSLEEAKKRDHRKLGQELDLFSIQELAGPGLIFFHPKGGMVRKHLEDWMRDAVPEARLLAGLHAARHAARLVEDLRPRQFLSARTCSRPWSWTTPNTSSSP